MTPPSHRRAPCRRFTGGTLSYKRTARPQTAIAVGVLRWRRDSSTKPRASSPPDGAWCVLMKKVRRRCSSSRVMGKPRMTRALGTGVPTAVRLLLRFRLLFLVLCGVQTVATTSLFVWRPSRDHATATCRRRTGKVAITVSPFRRSVPDGDQSEGAGDVHR